MFAKMKFLLPFILTALAGCAHKAGISVTGYIEKPGTHAAEPGKGLMELIYESGGISYAGSPRNIRIITPKGNVLMAQGTDIVFKNLNDPKIPNGSSIQVGPDCWGVSDPKKFNLALATYIKNQKEKHRIMPSSESR